MNFDEFFTTIVLFVLVIFILTQNAGFTPAEGLFGAITYLLVGFIALFSTLLSIFVGVLLASFSLGIGGVIAAFVLILILNYAWQGMNYGDLALFATFILIFLLIFA